MDDELETVDFNKMYKLAINEFTSTKMLILFIDWCEFNKMYDKVGERYSLAKKLLRNRQ